MVKIGSVIVVRMFPANPHLSRFLFPALRLPPWSGGGAGMASYDHHIISSVGLVSVISGGLGG